MRISLLGVLGFAVLLTTRACLPASNELDRTPQQGQTLGIALLAPSTTRTVAEGTHVSIDWTASNVTSQAATVTISIESRTDLSRQTLLDAEPLSGSGGSGTVDWNTDGLSGAYAVYGRIDSGGASREVKAAATITVQARPTFQFTAPAGDAQFQQGSTTPLRIEWLGGGTSATARIGLDTDTNYTDGNEIYLIEPNLPNPAATDSLDFTGKDKDGAVVPVATYNLFAAVTDNVNEVQYVAGLGQIEITAAEPNQPTTAEITDPNTDTTFLTTDPSLTITYKTHNTADVLVDIKIDTDDNHTNGNELTILSQQFVAANATPDPFVWNGNDVSGTAVIPGYYRLLLVVSTGSGTPTTVQSPAFVFRRSASQQPLVALIAPATLTKVDPGTYINIQWRDDDPAGNAKIRLVVALTPVPADHINDPPILADRPAAQDDVRDTFAWQVPSSGLTVGTPYYLIAYIKNDDAEALNSSSVAAGRIIVNDPTKP